MTRLDLVLKTWRLFPAWIILQHSIHSKKIIFVFGKCMRVWGPWFIFCCYPLTVDNFGATTFLTPGAQQIVVVSQCHKFQIETNERLPNILDKLLTQTVPISQCTVIHRLPCQYKMNYQVWFAILRHVLGDRDVLLAEPRPRLLNLEKRPESLNLQPRVIFFNLPITVWSHLKRPRIGPKLSSPIT